MFKSLEIKREREREEWQRNISCFLLYPIFRSNRSHCSEGHSFVVLIGAENRGMIGNKNGGERANEHDYIFDAWRRSYNTRELCRLYTYVGIYVISRGKSNRDTSTVSRSHSRKRNKRTNTSVPFIDVRTVSPVGVRSVWRCVFRLSQYGDMSAVVLGVVWISVVLCIRHHRC